MAPKRKLRSPQLEVRSRVDGAWYDGNVYLRGPELCVHFNGFSEEDDEVWDEEFLKSTTRIMAWMRLRSKQLQDCHCRTVSVGMVVCANFKTPDGSESKYYDARVVAIHTSKHSRPKGARKAERCNCRFKLVWEDGPVKNREVVLGCGDISFIDGDSVEKHPIVHGALRAARDHEKRLRECNPIDLLQNYIDPEKCEQKWVGTLPSGDTSTSYPDEKDTEGPSPECLATENFFEKLSREAALYSEDYNLYQAKQQLDSSNCGLSSNLN